MKSDVDPSTQRQVEEFHRRLERSERFWQEAMAVLAADRIMRDVATLYAPPRPRRRLLGRIARRLRRRLFRKDVVAGQTHEEPAVVVIDSICRDVSTSTVSPSYRPLKIKIK